MKTSEIPQNPQQRKSYAPEAEMGWGRPNGPSHTIPNEYITRGRTRRKPANENVGDPPETHNGASHMRRKLKWDGGGLMGHPTQSQTSTSQGDVLAGKRRTKTPAIPQKPTTTQIICAGTRNGMGAA